MGQVELGQTGFLSGSAPARGKAAPSSRSRQGCERARYLSLLDSNHPNRFKSKMPRNHKTFGNFLCAFIFVFALMHVFTVFRSRTLHVFNHEKAREETAADDVGNRTECGVMFEVA